MLIFHPIQPHTLGLMELTFMSSLKDLSYMVPESKNKLEYIVAIFATDSFMARQMHEISSLQWLTLHGSQKHKQVHCSAAQGEYKHCAEWV